MVLALVPAAALIGAFLGWQVVEARKRLRWWAESSGRVVRSARWRPLRLLVTRAVRFDAVLEDHGDVSSRERSGLRPTASNSNRQSRLRSHRPVRAFPAVVGTADRASLLPCIDGSGVASSAARWLGGSCGEWTAGRPRLRFSGLDGWRSDLMRVERIPIVVACAVSVRIGDEGDVSGDHYRELAAWFAERPRVGEVAGGRHLDANRQRKW